MKLFFSFAFFIPFCLQAQSIDTFSCKIVHAFKTRDSASLIQLVVQPADNGFIMQDQLKQSGLPVTVDTTSSTAGQQDSSWISSAKQIVEAFYSLRDKGTRLGVNWNSADCAAKTFETKKMEGSDLLTANGTIILRPGIHPVKFVLKGMVRINGSWRLTYIDIETD